MLDPFAGSGQTLKVARHLGRHYVGYETIEKYVHLAEARVNEPLALRAQQLIAVFDKIDLNDPLPGPPTSAPTSVQMPLFEEETP